jgi:NAD(P)-dependent dehydrogenase (short-subunit alcohol dehydrogenase family)
MTSDDPATATRVALVTGTRRIGGASAVALAECGFDVALAWHTSADAAEDAARRIRALGRRAVTLDADLARPDDCRALVSRTIDAFGRLDVLALFASRFERTAFDALDAAAWDAALAVDLSASFFCAQAATPHLRATRGRIVLVSDWVAVSGRPRYRGFLPYYVAKRGVLALGEALALELAGAGILVHTIAPGPIVPIAGSSGAEQQAVMAATPLGHWGGEAEVGRVVQALVESTFITGEAVRVDGGRHLR